MAKEMVAFRLNEKFVAWLREESKQGISQAKIIEEALELFQFKKELANKESYTKNQRAIQKNGVVL
jgi:hypothetical protein